MSKGTVLYRSILKAHKNRLPPELRKLGNDYVRNEFLAHKSAKDEHLAPFFKEWEGYLETADGPAVQVSQARGELEKLTVQTVLDCFSQRIRR